MFMSWAQHSCMGSPFTKIILNENYFFALLESALYKIKYNFFLFLLVRNCCSTRHIIMLIFTVCSLFRLLDGRFSEQLNSVLSHIPSKRQTLLFSATVTQQIKNMQDMATREVSQNLLNNVKLVFYCHIYWMNLFSLGDIVPALAEARSIQNQ